MAPSTFASAAAGNTGPNTPTRGESGSEWPRRTNGATQTFRRPSLATSMSSSNHQREGSATNAQSAPYVPPHRNGVMPDSRYTKSQLLDLYRIQQDAGSMQRDDSLTGLYVGGWEPGTANGALGGWSRNDDSSRDQVSGSEICWNRDGSVLPVGLVDMTEEEREASNERTLFSTSVNSPLKPPTATNKDGTPRDATIPRRISVSNNPNSPGAFGLASPGTTRSAGRRREASESYPFPTNPLASPPLGKTRDDGRTTSPPPSLRRRATDFKDNVPNAKIDEHDEMESERASEAAKTPFGGVSRSATNPLSAGLVGPSSPWASTPQATGFSPMGAFGNFAIGSSTAAAGTPGEKRPGFGGGRAESRFKGLMSKDNNEEGAGQVKEKPSFGNLGRLDDSSSWRPQHADPAPEGHRDQQGGPKGSAALGGGQDISPPQRHDLHGFGTPSRQDSRGDYGFAAFGMTTDNAARGPVHDQYQHQHQTPHGRHQHENSDTMSPTNTNPYQSPEQDHTDPSDGETDSSDIENVQLPGMGSFMTETGTASHGNFGALQHFPQSSGPPASDRSQTSSVGIQRGFTGLSGLGALPGLSGASSAWGSTQAALGTPLRDRAGLAGGFGDLGFGSAADVQSPGLAGLGPSTMFGGHQSMAPGAGRGAGRLSSMFPQGTQDALRGQDNKRLPQEEEKGLSSDTTQQPNFGRLAGLTGEDDGALRSTRGFGEAASGFQDRQRSDLEGESVFDNAGPSQSAAAQPIGSSASNQPPTAQQKTMVMPDRMRWIYRDPQGNTQGPWSGLEMHDWYKAGFFSPELLVKKFEDSEYEPLAQLIRRIGNSREPFLVPQIGIPHGAPSTQSWGAGPLPAAGTQPPFANSFPSFGTTLTADQQNALERRKQEEQYLMARQKEHLAQQQTAQRLQIQGQHSSLPQQLQHHSSAQSLHSQPSFGSMTSPNNYQPSPIQGPSQGQQHVPAFFGDATRGAQNTGFGAVGAGIDALGNISEEELPGMTERLALGQQNQARFGAPGQGQLQQSHQNDQKHAQQVSAMLDDRSRLQHEQAQHDTAQRATQPEDPDNGRLREFQNLQRRYDQEARMFPGEQQHAPSQSKAREPLSLTEQVQQAASAQQSPAVQSPWGKVEVGLPQPFPPAPSQSPLPAPAAQRNRSHVAEALHAESRSRSQTPSVETPGASIAPWAKETAEGSRGPSLKEIQELEARKAAKAEAIAAEQRRTALEKEVFNMQASASPTIGLPSSANWASNNTASPVSGATPWAKATKPAPTPSTAKSMAQIQKEEEARKKKIAAAAAAINVASATALGSPAAQAAGKRYAELASKVANAAAATSPGPPGAWTTVGASGKVKPPVTPAAVGSATRVPSVGSVATAAAAVKKPSTSRSVTMSGISASGDVNVQEEFKKWAVNELKHDLNKGVSADEFVSNLLAFPTEPELVTEAVHSVSTTIDSRHFAEEFLRRRKLADKGLLDASAVKSASPSNVDQSKQGGWSEVAKKGPVKEKEDVAGVGGFKVVPAKKKGAKR